MDFIRYYTVTLLTENLYILTVTLMLVPFVRWVRLQPQRPGPHRLRCGISTITACHDVLRRPCAGLDRVPVAGSTHAARDPALTAAGVAVSAWILTIAPVTARNWVVAHRFVTIADVPARVSDLLQNFPSTVDASPYIARFHGTMGSGLSALIRSTWDHPWAMSAFHLRKLGFSLGMIQWFGGYRPHPELAGVSILYIVMCVASSRMRDRAMWPVHLFVVTHLASMIITIPWNYGYRLILPAFVYTTTLSVAAFTAWLMARPGAGSRARFEANA